MESNTFPRHVPKLEGVLEIGPVRIPYRVRESQRAKRKRIVVEPGSVELVLPAGASVVKGHEFMRAKRRWVFNKATKLGALKEREQTYLSGTKVRFRGRWLTLEVKAGRSKAGSVAYRSRFYVTLPRGVAKTVRPRIAKELLDAWTADKLIEDGRRFARQFAEKLGVEIGGVALVPMKRMWASCGKDGVIRLNPQLIELPRAVLEYVIAHEICHRVHRNHSPAFWRAVGGVMPDWREREAWLGKYEQDWSL